MKRTIAHMLAALSFAFLVSPAAALALADCARATHNMNTGEARHMSYVGGRVSWVEWWSNEGLFLDLVVMDCDTGGLLKTRTLEENISDRWLNNRVKAREILDTEMAVAPALFSFTRLAGAFKGVGRDIEIDTTSAESCACAAAHPELRGTKTEFELEE